MKYVPRQNFSVIENALPDTDKWRGIFYVEVKQRERQENIRFFIGEAVRKSNDTEITHVKTPTRDVC